MAFNALIGALRVSLGLDSAHFQTGLKQSQAKLGAFGKAAGVALAAVSAAAVTAGVALAGAVKSAADHADELGKMAQKVGVSVEALSRLEYAGKLADVSLEQLGTGLRKLSQGMLDIAAGRGQQVKTAFDALGISVKNANGTLRASDDVLRDVADKFARMEDGTTKTALAVSLFGRAGAELIPLLNAGKAGLSDMAAEADRLGITISTKTAKSAEAFNDNLTRMNAVGEGLANKIMEAVIPSLESLTNTMASPEFQTAIVNTTTLLTGLADVLARSVILAGELVNVLPKAVNASEDRSLYANLPGYEDFISRHEVGAGGSSGIGGGPGSFAGMQAAFGVKAGGATAPFTPIITGASGAKKALIELTDTGDRYTETATRMTQQIGEGLGGAFSRLADAVLSGNDALSSTVDILMDLGKQLVQAGIQSFFTNLFSGALMPGMGLGSGAVGRGVYGGNTGFFPGFPGLAGGTDNWRGGMTWVGENGPELLNLPRGSQVIPNHELGGGQSVVKIDLGPGLVGTILKQAGNQAVQIVQTQAPLAVQRSRFDRKGG